MIVTVVVGVKGNSDGGDSVDNDSDGGGGG